MNEGVPHAKSRIVWQDVARGIGIVLVVLGHVVQGLTASHLLDAKRWHAFDFSLYTFHMPMFLFLAGLNVPHSLAPGRGRFLRSRLLGILYPYILWSVIQVLVMSAGSGLTNGQHGIRQLARIPWSPVPPFWFLYALFLFSVAVAFVRAELLLILSVVTLFLSEPLSPDSFPHQLLHFPCFFLLGVLFSARMHNFAIPAQTAWAAAMTAALTIWAGLNHRVQSHNSMWMLPATVGGSLFVFWIAQRLQSVRLLAWLGRISLAVYVMHFIAASGTRIVLQKLLHAPPIGWVYLVVVTFAGVALPACAYRLAERYGLLSILGLKIGSRGARWVNRHSAEQTFTSAST